MLQSLDVALFRFINGTLSHPFLDATMPLFAGNAWFWPVLVIAAGTAIWRGGARGRVLVLMLAIIIPVGDGWITNTIKHAVERPRPCLTLPGVNLPINKAREAATGSDSRRSGCSNSGSFPSAHTTNWFAATMVAWIFYRRTLRFMLPLAFVVAFSRVYNGVHYPSDVLGGAIIGAGYGAALVLAIDAAWRGMARRFLPLWYQRLPSLVTPGRPMLESAVRSLPAVSPESHWLRLGYTVIVLVFLGRILYLGSHVIELSEDEAYQWLWSKHPALSYFSKPPLIAYVQWLGTHLFGDTELGVRFFSPVLAAIASLVMLRFFAKHANARAGFWLVMVLNVTPLVAVGSTLLTVDPLLVFFWTMAMASGWRAVQPDGKARHWMLVGAWMGLAFLSKYTALLQWLCWAIFFLLSPSARVHLRKAGPYLAVVVNAIFAVPVLIWNAQHGWISASHVATDAKLKSAWHYSPANMLEFLGGSAGLMHPIFFVAAIWACVAMWKRSNALLRYFFCMGTPLFAVYFLYTIHSGVLINWIAAAIIPMFCVMVLYWDQRDREGAPKVRKALGIAVCSGVLVVAFLHESKPFLEMIDDVTAQFALRPLPVKLDPLRRVRGWSQMAKVVTREWRDMEKEGKPAFIVAGHYGTTSLLSFYMPEARKAGLQKPLVYCRYSPKPRTQFYFWPTYVGVRTGEDAIYVQEKDKPEPAPRDIERQFESVTEVGRFPVVHRGRVLHHVQVFACRNLR